jgi:hypothetical protein
MFFWHAAAMLALDAARVVNMRLQSIASGQSSQAEMLLMVSEKLDAISEAQIIFCRGGDASLVIDHYRKVVTANVARLSAR